MIIKRHMDQEIQELHALLREMERNDLAMYEAAIDYLRTRNPECADRVLQLENLVNRAQMKIDDLAWKIMALYQPTASDLRLLIGAIKETSDLERIGDEVCAITRRAREIAVLPEQKMPPEIVEMEVMVKSIFKDGLFAISKLDEELAESIFTADDSIDKTFETLFQNLQATMKQAPDRIEALLGVLSIARSLERIADLATNLAEVTIFMKKGQDVRHHGLQF